MLRRLLSLALCVFPAIAIDCDKCTGRDCFETCFYLQKILTTEAKYKCSSCSSATTTTGATNGCDRRSGPRSPNPCQVSDTGSSDIPRSVTFCL